MASFSSDLRERDGDDRRLLVLGGGSAIALSGTNTVDSGDIIDNQVKSADVRNDTLSGGGLTSADIKNGTVSVLDTNKVIPSGATVIGVFSEFEDDSFTTGGTPLADLVFGVDFHGLRAPTPLTDADINFDDIGISAAAAVDGPPSTGGEEDPNCTGGLATPTAPPGKVCIYLSDEQVSDGSAEARNLGAGTAFPAELNDRGFKVRANNPGSASLLGTWAYTAP